MDFRNTGRSSITGNSVLVHKLHVEDFPSFLFVCYARCYRHVQRRDKGDIGRRMLEMELPGRRQRGRPKRRLMDTAKEDMQVVGVRVENTKNRLK